MEGLRAKDIEAHTQACALRPVRCATCGREHTLHASACPRQTAAALMDHVHTLMSAALQRLQERHDAQMRQARHTEAQLLAANAALSKRVAALEQSGKSGHKRGARRLSPRDDRLLDSPSANADAQARHRGGPRLISA